MSRTREVTDYDRDADDWYVEPRWTVEALLDAEPFVGSVWDPACGGGTIPDVCRGRGMRAFGSDKVYRGYGLREADFLSEGRCPDIDPPYDNIITNPPYKDAEAFARRALDLAHFKVAMLVQRGFLYSQDRYPLFTETPVARIYHLSSRPSMPPGALLAAGEIKARGGKVDYCWVVWAKDHKGPPTTHWLLRPARHRDAQAARAT